MSAEASPISPSQFALAIQDLPLENVYAKAHEIENSISHLQRSNDLLKQYSDSIRNDNNLQSNTREEGDKDCVEAIQENVIVIDRQKERVDLLKREVERRGGRWHGTAGASEENNNGDTALNGSTTETQRQQSAINGGGPAFATGGTLSDEELQRMMEQRMAEGEDEDTHGMHL